MPEATNEVRIVGCATARILDGGPQFVLQLRRIGGNLLEVLCIAGGVEQHTLIGSGRFCLVAAWSIRKFRQRQERVMNSLPSYKCVRPLLMTLAAISTVWG